ncbi:hypothetical protein PHMEG_0006736 [Phytophthora megakarya]|uniref:DNA endonuclease activator Ctp1 C-terminal domain-containing protein n=1 Tax=Phytophthora megakarya TaxID=4795 RepID=A0A225WPM4_9STRA|nr:hypothetical protein PHMEG_0006736 [Phytophthora megakarya]
MEWKDEKEELLAIIRRQEQEATTLAKRFKLLQKTLKEQQKLLDRYQRALAASHIKRNPATENDETSSNDKTNSKDKTRPNSELKASTWIQKKTICDLEAGTEASTAAVKEVQEKKDVFKPQEKRNRTGLAATWAEEKRKMKKKPKWQQTIATSSSNKENVEQTTDNAKSFAYVEVVRNRDERKELPAHDCFECKKYYDALGGIGAAAQKNKCSRHRARFEPYQTPDDFWRLSFPDSEPGPY